MCLKLKGLHWIDKVKFIWKAIYHKLQSYWRKLSLNYFFSNESVYSKKKSLNIILQDDFDKSVATEEV